jgi:hypothetical protein
MSFNDAIVVDPKTFTDCVLGYFEPSIKITPQGGSKKESDGEGKRAGSKTVS